MFQIKISEDKTDILAKSTRCLNIKNINQNSIFEPVQTRIPTPEEFKSNLKKITESYFKININIDLDEKHDINDINDLFSDNFNRDFVPIKLPEVCNEIPENFFGKKAQNIYYNCDIPTPNLRNQRKITLDDAIKGHYQSTLPSCNMCNSKCRYPFYNSIDYSLCSDCYCSGNIGKNTCTLDYVVVKEDKLFDGDWSFDELYELVDNFVKNGDNWSKISELMKNRTCIECLLQFIRLPMTDNYYNIDFDLIQPSKYSVLDNKMADFMPFMCTQYPISTYCSFLCGVDEELGNIIAEKATRFMKDDMLPVYTKADHSTSEKSMQNIVSFTQIEASSIASKLSKELIQRLSSIIYGIDDIIATKFSSLIKKVRSRSTNVVSVEIDEAESSSADYYD